jgi:heat shock transcription factor, other eukaryote
LLQGFRKVDPDRWDFANEAFLRGKRDLLKTIKRRRPPATCLEVGQFGREGEVHRLQRDRGVLLAEVVKLRQEQQATRAQMQAMEERITVAEQKQQQMTVFLARAMRNPGFLKMLVDRQRLVDGCRKELEDELSKKRRRPIEYFPGDGETSAGQASRAAMGDYVVGASEAASEDESRRDENGGGGEDTESFWVELLNLGLEEKRGTARGGAEGSEADVDDDVDVLVQSIYHLNPNPGSHE